MSVRDAAISHVTGRNGMPKLEMVHASGSKCDVYLFGATITSYETASGEEVLYTSPLASFDGRQAIRGGIPIVFPCFGASESNKAMPSHGFARIMAWTVRAARKLSWIFRYSPPARLSRLLFHFTSPQVDERQTAVQPDGSIQVVLHLSDSSETKQKYGFKYDFNLEYAVKLTGRSLQTALTVTNPRLVEIEEGFQCLLHTYLALPESTTLDEVAVHGLHGANYIDKNDNRQEKIETRASRRDRDTGDFISGGVRITEATDRIYKAGTGDLRTVAGAEVHFFRNDAPKQKCAITVVEATCSRAANTTWSGATPSPDIVLWAPFSVSFGVAYTSHFYISSSGRTYMCPTPLLFIFQPSKAPADLGNGCERMICVEPGLVSTPIKTLINGRMTLTQTITHES